MNADNFMIIGYLEYIHFFYTSNSEEPFVNFLPNKTNITLNFNFSNLN